MTETNLMAKSRALLHEWVQSESLRKHCEAVSACMRHFARKTGADEDLWGAVGLLHDMDYEKHPVLEWSETGHTFLTVAYLKEHGWSDEITRAVASHAGYSGIDPITSMEKTLTAVDELSGFVTAVALVRPDKSVNAVEVKSVTKKMKDKAFAAKVSRDDIRHGAEILDMPLENLIQEVILALREEADLLGLQGTRA
jgi:putative nucleotidyltransferase with HDIG domain